MIRNYIKLGWRNIARQKQFSVLNIIGLSVGFTSCLLVFLYVHNELSYDTYHTKLDRIFRVLHAYGKEEPIAPEGYQVWGGAPVGPALLEEFPEVESFCRFTSPNIMLLEHGENRFQENNILFADSTAFEIFSWNLLEGNPATALKEPNAIVLTQSMAKKYFGNESALGQVITVDHKDLVTVTGVMEDLPSQSQLTFDALVSMVTFHRMRPNIFGYWGYVDFYTYVQLSQPSAVQALKEKTKTLYGHRIPENVGAARLDYEPMEGSYLNSVASRQPGPTGNLTDIYMISCIGIFILVIACVNFINLTTARSVERAKEVGVRKTLGARRRDLAFQFLAESVLITLFSVILAITAVAFLSYYLSQLVGKPIAYDVLLTWQSGLLLIGLTLFIGIIAGLYPSWILTKFRPTEVLKGKFKSSRSGSNLRRILVVFQFSLATLLIIATTVVYNQLQYLKNQDRGFTEDQMLVIDF
ncbi:ABC transporter permease, partial [Reichenbachiella sp.]